MIINWSASPEILSLGSWSLRWYGVLFALGFFMGYRIVEKICIVEKKDTKILEKLLMYLVLGTVVGARVGHCLFYEPSYYLQNPIEIFMVWKGGLASHGGTIGVILSIVFFCRKYKEFELFWLFDRIAYPSALASAFIRLGNLMNSEILGKPTDGSWGVVFSKVDQIPRHPGQLYESLTYFLVFWVAHIIYKKLQDKTPRGLLFGWVIFSIFSSRIILERFKENQESFESSMILNMGQILSIPFALVGLYFIVNSIKSFVRLNSKIKT